jgi:integration host factor subunit alpha
MSLGKKDIIKNISSKAQLSSSESYDIFHSFLNFIKYNKSNIVKISNFGSFRLHKSPMRIGRNPKTKEEFMIRSRNTLKFKASNALKGILN